MKKPSPSSVLRFLLIPAALLLLVSLGLYISGRNGFRENSDFDSFTSSMFQDEITSNTLNLHYTLDDPSSFGIQNYPVTLGESDEASLCASTAVLENYRTAMERFNYSSLSSDNQLTYDILDSYLKTQNEGKDFGLYSEPLGPTIGTQAQLPVLLAEYSFRKKSDVEEYLTLLAQLPKYYTSIMDFEKSKSKAGLFMSDTNADAIISQCSSFISDPENNFLISVFDDKVDSLKVLTPEENSSYKSRHKEIVKKEVVNAYDILIQELTKLKGTGKNEGGLSNLPKGTDYYRYLVKETTGSSASVERIEQRLTSQLETDFKELKSLIGKNPSLLSANPALSLAAPDAILKELQNKMKADFPNPPQVNYKVKYVHSSLEEYLSPAFYLSPPIDNLTNNVIYINQASGYSPLELYTTLAHEGYPGHLYQTIYSASVQSDPVRSLLNFGGFVEGWATYVESMSYSYPDVDKNVASLYRLNRSIMLGISSLMDIAVHFHGYSKNAVSAYLGQLGFTDQSVADNLYGIIIEAPANYLKYYVGCLTFTDIRDHYKKELGEKFNLKDFHQQILTIGPAPFPVLEKYLDQYYKLS